MTPEESIQVVAVLRVAFPNAKFPDETAKLYAASMQRLPVEQGRQAVQKAVERCRFLPTLAELLEFATPQQKASSGLEAWGIVSAEVRRVGRYETPSFDDPKIARAVELFGWQNICDSTDERVDRAHFSKLFDGLSDNVTPTERRIAPTETLNQLTQGIGRGI